MSETTPSTVCRPAVWSPARRAASTSERLTYTHSGVVSVRSIALLRWHPSTMGWVWLSGPDAAVAAEGWTTADTPTIDDAKTAVATSRMKRRTGPGSGMQAFEYPLEPVGKPS